MTGGIYKITNLINNKIYIGSTVNFNKRKLEHFSMSNKCSKLLLKAFKKYGVNNFIFEIIEYCEKDKLYELEQKWFDYYKPWHKQKGYNISKIARGSRDNFNKKTAAKSLNKKIEKGYNKNTYPKLSLSKLQDKNPMFGKFGSNSPTAKPIYVYTKDGKFYKKFSSQVEAKKELNLKVLHAERGYSKDYQFSYEFFEKLPPRVINSKGNKKSVGKFLNNDLIEIFESVTLASKSLSISRATIHRILNGKINYKFTLKYI